MRHMMSVLSGHTRLKLQAQVEGGAVPQDTARDSAEKTLAALTEQNQRLSGEKAAAEAQARDATVRSRV